ncbi:hypothetical protein M3B74_20715 [Citrobacter freundii]|uniref:hypothetical protein n=1 Tax=Citrobacter TaxID=544 RepID=UPI000F4FE68C|nr:MULTISPECIES: hypothetical protein [Citrobacter]HED2482788.1 hypothetical protein [Citrobacter youngae]AYY47077.1 hypothetical protein EGX89_00140 [Citrobacter freundii]MBJ9559437.1 hypothetical protein [Citrobacter sp. FDAARGOS_156]MCT1497440.1 hypothetical protein [Citrobacter freundii]MDU7352085.1 hypothetical protein [Citrobacter freundii]
MLRNILQDQALEIVHKHFQSLSRRQLEICLLHTFGVAKSMIASNYNITVEAVKQNIKRSVQKLELDNSDALRIAILSTIFVIMLKK